MQEKTLPKPKIRTSNIHSGDFGSVSYDIFGSPYQKSGSFLATDSLDFGYLGKPYNADTELYDYGFRDYSPEIARFTTVDPIRDGRNWYSYVVNDPVNYVDLWGLECKSSSDEENTREQSLIDKLKSAVSNIFKLDSRENNYPKLEEQLKNFNQSVLILNVAPNFSSNTRREDPVEYDLNSVLINNVFNIENIQEFDFVLNQIPDTVKDLIITGAHGSKDGKLGKIDFSSSTISNLDKNLNVYLPDCYMGIENNKKELAKIFGSDVNVFARDYATWEEGVCMFIQEVTKQKNVSSTKIQNSFEKNIKKVGR